MKLYEMKGKMKEMAKDVMDYKEECKDDADEMYLKKKKMKEMQDKELEEEFFGEGDDSDSDSDDDDDMEEMKKKKHEEWGNKRKQSHLGSPKNTELRDQSVKNIADKCGRASVDRGDAYKACGKDGSKRGSYWAYPGPRGKGAVRAEKKHVQSAKSREK